ncbi:MAG: putative metal-binding motif-containing protein [Methylophilaceae bacterium]
MMIKHMMKYRMTRWYALGIALLVIAAYANAEQPKIGKSIEVKKLKDIKKPTTIQKPTLQKTQPNGNLTHRYTATFSQPLKHSGTLTINNIRWQCNRIQKQCTALNIKKALSMQDCRQLANHQNQKLRKFGAQKNMFSFSQLSQCNTTVRTTAKTQAPIKPVNQNATYQASAPNTKNIGVSPTAVQQAQVAGLGGSNIRSSAKISKFNNLSHKIKQKIKLDLDRGTPNAYGGHGRRFSGSDCNDDRRDANPNATEVCDHIDNDCDGLIDEGQTIPYYLDADGDNHGDPARRIDACPADVTDATNDGEWLVRVGNDCDDTDPAKWHNCS